MKVELKNETQFARPFYFYIQVTIIVTPLDPEGVARGAHYGR